MPNHVTNRLYASKKVLDSLIGEDGEVDFNKIIPCEIPNEYNGYFSNVTTFLEHIFDFPLSDHELLASMQRNNRKNTKFSSFNDEQKVQFYGMIENYRETGYLNSLYMSIDKWHTKWNAYDSGYGDDHLFFDTAWSCPIPIFQKLSEMFPEEVILVKYADEDIGHNCGRFSYLNGFLLSSESSNNSKSGAYGIDYSEKLYWKRFAYQVKNFSEEEIEELMSEEE